VAVAQLVLVRSMRVLMALLILGCLACLVSAVTGIQALEAGSRTGTVISYHHGYGRLYAVAAAVFFAVAFYGVYRRFPIVWKLGWIFLVAGTADFIVEAWLGLIHRPYGWVGALAATLGGLAMLAYWGIWWQRHREYFTPEGPPPGWAPDLSLLRWFAIGMVVLTLIAIVAALALSCFHHSDLTIRRSQPLTGEEIRA